MREFGARSARAPIEMRVDLKARNESFAATSKNLSVGGLFVATDRQVRVGEQVTVELSLPGHVLPIVVGAEVRWMQMSDDRPFGLVPHRRGSDGLLPERRDGFCRDE
jgi:uncharacterized protein (TIGR02266 family)